MVLIPCINILYKGIRLKMSLLLIMKFINESIYWHGTGRISNCLNSLLRNSACNCCVTPNNTAVVSSYHRALYVCPVCECPQRKQSHVANHWTLSCGKQTGQCALFVSVHRGRSHMLPNTEHCHVANRHGSVLCFSYENDFNSSSSKI